MSILDTIFRFPANDIGTANITEPQFTKGFAGELNAASKLVFENDQVILAVDYQFEQAPLYIDFDLNSRQIQIVQQTGDVATLRHTAVPIEKFEQFQNVRTVAFVTGQGDDKLVQVLKLRLKGTMPAAA